MRFLTDPNFVVKVNGEEVSFNDIRDPNITKEDLVTSDGNAIQLIIINTQSTDRTAKQHGIAWHVRGRLVGGCSWDAPGLKSDDFNIDQRRIAARRFVFIVKADHLASEGAIKSDWSGFDSENTAFKFAADVVYRKVNEYLLSASEDDRQATLVKAKSVIKEQLKEMSPLQRETWIQFVDDAQKACPSVRENDIVKLSQVVANLELAKSKYSLIHKLSQIGPEQIDDLNDILEKWTIGMVKEVLDEIFKRLKLIQELKIRVADKKTREVQDLQPLFEKGLWIFGPEFETIEYTSNVGMTRVVQELFKHNVTGSLNRPDFAILPLLPGKVF